MCTALAIDNPRVAQATDDLLEVGAWQVFGFGDVGEGDRLAFIHTGEGDHESNAVLATGAERDGACPMETAGGLLFVLVQCGSLVDLTKPVRDERTLSL